MPGRDTDWDELADRLGAAAVADGDPTRWYDELWAAGARGEISLPWDRDAPYDLLAAYVDQVGPGEGRRAVVVGAGLGADAELLAGRGWAVTGIDISPSAVTAVRERHRDTLVDYRVADLLELPSELHGRFDLVVEIFTLQALHPSLRVPARTGLRRLLAPAGVLFVVQMVRADDEPVGDTPPWRLTRAEVADLGGDGLVLDTLDRLPHPRPGRLDRWRAVLTR